MAESTTKGTEVVTPGEGGITFVTGGAGHLGANLVRALLARGEEVRCLVMPGHNNRGLEGLDIEIVEGDLRDKARIHEVIKGCKRIYHTAAKVSTLSGPQEIQDVYDINVMGTRYLLDAAKEHGVEKVVVTGSLSATGFDKDNTTTPMAEDTLPFNPFINHMPYGRTKHMVETLCFRAALDGLPVVVATSCAIMGPNDFLPSRLGRSLKDFANGDLRAYIPGGFEFVATKDIVAGHLLSMEKGRTGHKYIFSTQFLTMDELMGLYEQATGVPRPKLRLPPKLMLGVATVHTWYKQTFRPKAPHRFTPYAVWVLGTQRHADTSKAQQELGFKPSSMLDTICEQVEFFKELGWIQARRGSARLNAEVG